MLGGGALAGGALLGSLGVGLGLSPSAAAQEEAQASSEASEAPVDGRDPAATGAPAVPKYIFLFIGDGMSYPQIQAAAYAAGSTPGESPQPAPLNFMGFPVAGAQYTYNTDSYCPDSASTATAIATGEKTASGYLSISADGERSMDTIAERLKREKGYRVGIVTSVNVNHATPAAFYAHRPGRGDSYAIGCDLIASGFDYIAGGEFMARRGDDGAEADLHQLAAEAGYEVACTYDQAASLQPGSKAIAISEALADNQAFSYALDRAEGEWSLADYLRKGLEVLLPGGAGSADDQGFFLMCEGGKIDWACHGNDCAAMIGEVRALEESVAVALEFAADHPDETLIIVTGDHETGGLTLGYAETGYETFLHNIRRQRISTSRFDTDYSSHFVAEGTSFNEAMAAACELFGFSLPGVGDPSDTLTLTAYELEDLREAYERTCAVGPADQSSMTPEQYVHYGSYQPFTVTLARLLSHKSGIDFASYAHSGLAVPVFAFGCGAQAFAGLYDNTDIFRKLATLTALS